MAVFNPGVQPTQDPNYLNYAHVVEAPQPNQSAAIAIGTASQGIEGAVSFVDSAIKKGIQDDAYAKVDPYREQFTSALEGVKARLGQSPGQIPVPVQQVSQATTGRSWLDANAMAPDPEVPVGLDSGLDRINQLAAAKAAGSPKLNDTQFSMDTLSVAKQLRATYGEGYRPYIDDQVSKASGLPVANSYMQNMLQDINRQLLQQHAAKDDVVSMMEKNPDVPNMGQYYQKYNQGDPSITKTMIFQKVSDWQNLQTQQKIDAAKRSESTDNLATKQRDDERSITKTYNDTVGLYTSDVVNLSGMSSGLGGTMKYIQEVQAGLHPEATDTEVKQRVQQLQAYRQGIDMQLANIGHNANTSLDSDKLEKIRKNALAPIDTLIALSNDKNSSPAFFHLNQIEAIKADDQYNWLTSKDKGALSRQMLTGRAIMGEQYFPDWIRTIVSTPGPDGKPLDGPIQAAFGQEAMSAIAPIADKRGQPVPRYMKDAVQHGKEVDVDNANYYGKVVGLVSSIADPKMPMDAKDKLIDWAFNGKNIGVLNELKTDYTDPATGLPVPGKYHAFNVLTAPAVTNAVRESAKVHPENYQKYSSTMEQEFGTLYRSDVDTLNKRVGGHPEMGLHFSYNDITNHFGLVDSNNRPVQRNDRAMGIQNPGQVYINGTLDVIDRLNQGVGNLAIIHKNDPAGATDTSKYLLQTLQTIGWRPGDNITGATKEMAKAIIKSKQPDMTPEQLDQQVLPGKDSMNFAPEDDATLTSFLRSPAGNYHGQSQFVSNPTNIPLPKQPRGIRGNLSDEPLAGIRTDEIPEGMTAREFLNKLKRENR